MFRTLIRATRLVWALPVILLGVLAALPFWTSSQWRVRDGCLIIVSHGRFAKWMDGQGWAGVTIGATVLLWVLDDERVLAHELEHVEQWYTWGVLFPLAYGYECARRGYYMNRFEVAARRKAGDAWRP